MRGHLKELSLLILRNTGHENETSAVFSLIIVGLLLNKSDIVKVISEKIKEKSISL